MNEETRRLHQQTLWKAIKAMPEATRRRWASRAQTQFLRMPPPREALPCPPKWSPLWWAIQRRKEKEQRLAPSLGTPVPYPARKWVSRALARQMDARILECLLGLPEGSVEPMPAPPRPLKLQLEP
jgi:hypothetical protein